MDSNGQSFWLALGGRPWNPEIPGTLEQLSAHLRLASQSPNRTYAEQPALAAALLDRVPMARDAFGARAFVSPDGLTVRATGTLPEPEPIIQSPVLFTATAPVTDLALGHDGILYILTGGKIVLRPIDNRYSQTTREAAGFSAWRFAASPEGGGWALDRTNRKLARLSGRLQPDPLAFAPPPPTEFVPSDNVPDEPGLTVIPDGWLSAEETPVALACSPEGRLAVLLWNDDAEALVRLVTESGEPGPTATLNRVEKPFSLAWLSEDTFAVLLAREPETGVPSPPIREAVAYNWREGAIFPTGEVYPLRGHDDGPFLHTVGPIAEYPTKQPTTELPNNVAPRPLVALALSALAKNARCVLAQPFDSGQPGTAWHRLFVDASLPPGTGFTVEAASNDDGNTPDDDQWHPHHFGASAPAHRHEPRAAWMCQPSEIPGQKGFCDEAPRRNENGLFSVLLQRANCPVRTLRGRFLHLRLTLRGNLQSTPCIHALRAYGPRFSYQDKYLPALYRESLHGPEAETVLPGQSSTRADFLGRFLANFEGILTPLEDKVADSWLLTDPYHTPKEAIDWLGSWIGVSLAPWYPDNQRRRHVQTAPQLFRQRGTMKGLKLALDVATDNAVSKGRVVIVEDHWFRRTLQTVLGVKLDREDDPLLGGNYVTGDSKVGRTLFLSEEGTEKKFLALFDASIDLKENKAAIDEFFSSLAHRVTVIVHEQTSPAELKLIERICAQETPGHVVVKVRLATADFMVGLTALMGVDTYLRPHPEPQPVEVGNHIDSGTAIGGGALLLRPASLDPRLEGI